MKRQSSIGQNKTCRMGDSSIRVGYRPSPSSARSHVYSRQLAAPRKSLTVIFWAGRCRHHRSDAHTTHVVCVPNRRTDNRRPLFYSLLHGWLFKPELMLSPPERCWSVLCRSLPRVSSLRSTELRRCCLPLVAEMGETFAATHRRGT